MVNISEENSYYSGYNHQVNKDRRPFYVDDWTWDTYLAAHPLRMILHPAQEEDMLQRTSPELGMITPPRILIRVDFPWPLRPRMAIRPRRGSSKDRSL